MYQEPRRLLQAALRTVDGMRERGEARVPQCAQSSSESVTKSSRA